MERNCFNHTLVRKELIVIGLTGLLLLKLEKCVVEQISECVVEELAHRHLAILLSFFDVLQHQLEDRIRLTTF